MCTPAAIVSVFILVRAERRQDVETLGRTYHRKRYSQGLVRNLST